MGVNCYLKFADPAIFGESTDPVHAGEIQVLSWSHSFNQPAKPTDGAAGDGAATQANHADFAFSKYLDTATDDLLKHCWNGKAIGQARLSCYRSEGDEAALLYLQVDMEDIVVSNISIGGGQGDLPTENISLAYGKVSYAYTSQTPGVATTGGVQTVSHDLIRQAVS